jgi:hypothetical protein
MRSHNQGELNMIEFSVIQNNLSAGTNIVSVPLFPTRLVGIESAGIYAVAIITPSKQYIVPFASAGGIVQKYVPCVMDVTGNQINTSVLAGSGTLIWLFGTPSQSDLRYPVTVYAGVIGSLTTSQTSGTATGSITLTFPSGNLIATGIAILVTATNSQAQATLTTSSGTTLTYAGFSNQIGGTELIAPLGNIVLGQTLTINVTTFAAMTVYVIVYYAE